MLDSKDLEILQAMMKEVVEASEARMTAKIEDSIAASESRMTARIEERVEDTRSMIMGYLESAIEPKLSLLAEGHQLLRETMAPKNRVDQLEEEVSFLRQLIMSLGRDVAELKKAQ